MRTLNAGAADQLHDLEAAAGDSPVHAVTDVTGFGLAGHGWEMAERSGVTVRFHAGGAAALPGRLGRGRRRRPDRRRRTQPGLPGRPAGESSVPDSLAALAIDPQTSGGLLAAVGPDHAAGLWRLGLVGSGRGAGRAARRRAGSDGPAGIGHGARRAPSAGPLGSPAEVSERLVGSAAFKAVGCGDPTAAGSIPVHLRHRAPPTPDT